MGAHTAVAYALRHPERLTGLVVDRADLHGGDLAGVAARTGTGWPTALEAGGVDGFVAYIAATRAIDAAWRDSVLGFTRARMLLHRHPEALVEALREVPRSRPFGSLEELRRLDLPALVVASHDDADPGHPYAVAGRLRGAAAAGTAGQRGGRASRRWPGRGAGSRGR